MKAMPNRNNLIIPSMRLPSGAMSAEKSVDLSGLQGQSVRVYLSAAGMVEINPQYDSYWMVAEVVLPLPATQQVQNGTRIDTARAAQEVTRGAGGADTITLAAGQRVGSVGHWWAPYRPGIDYSEASGVITWLGRQPQAGNIYPVEILTDTTVPAVEQRELPLDLVAHPVVLFDLPL